MSNNTFHHKHYSARKSSIKFCRYCAGVFSRLISLRIVLLSMAALMVLWICIPTERTCYAEGGSSESAKTESDKGSDSNSPATPVDESVSEPNEVKTPDTTEALQNDEMGKLMTELLKATESGMDPGDPRMMEMLNRIQELEKSFSPVTNDAPPPSVSKPVQPRPVHKAVTPGSPASATASESKAENGSTSGEAAKEDASSSTEIDAGVGDDAIVQIKMKNDLLDVNLLIETVGKELHFTFLYDNAQGISGSVKLQKFGPIRRRDLLPLLESVLRFQGFTMIREDPFIRIVKQEEAHTKATPFLAIGETEAEVEAGNSIVTQLIQPSYIGLEELKGFLSNFTDPKVMVSDAKANYLIITEYASRMTRLLELAALVDQPGPEKKLEPIEVKHIPAKDAKTQIDELIDALAGEGIDETPAPADPKQPPAPRRRPLRGRTAAPTPTAVHAEGPELLVDERTNRLLVVGTEDQIDRVRQLLTLLDVKGGTEIRLEIVQVQHVVVEDLTQQLADLIKALTEQEEIQSTAAPAATEKEQPADRRPTRRTRDTQASQGPTKTGIRGPILLNDERTNRLFIIGTEDQIKQAQELLAILDIPPYEYGQPVLRIYQPQYVEAEEVRRILEQLGIIETGRVSARDRARRTDNVRDRERDREGSPRPAPTNTGETFGLAGMEEPEIKVAVQESTNKIFVLAMEQQHKDIAEIMSHVDLEFDESLGAIRVYPLENREPALVAEMLASLLESEQMDVEKKVKIPGKEGSPIIVALDDIYAIAVRGSKKQHEDIGSIIKILDKRLPQVLVEAVLVKVTNKEGFDLGTMINEAYSVEGGKRGDNTRGMSGGSSFPIGDSGFTRSATGIVSGNGPVMAFFTDDLVYAAIESLQTQSNGKIVSKPRLLVNDNEQGTIVSQEESPTTKTTVPPGSDLGIVEFAGYESAGTTLDITPHISEGNFLQLDISLQVDSFVGTGTGNVPPAKTSNQIKTLVTVPDGKTIVLGGLTGTNEGQSENKVPLLGDIPIIGALFRGVSQSKDQNILYVFVRANIVRNTGEGGASDFSDLDELSEYYRNQLRRSETEQSQLPIIPGIKNKNKKPSHVLDE